MLSEPIDAANKNSPMNGVNQILLPSNLLMLQATPI